MSTHLVGYVLLIAMLMLGIYDSSFSSLLVISTRQKQTRGENYRIANRLSYFGRSIKVMMRNLIIFFELGLYDQLTSTRDYFVSLRSHTKFSRLSLMSYMGPTSKH